MKTFTHKYYFYIKTEESLHILNIITKRIENISEDAYFKSMLIFYLTLWPNRSIWTSHLIV